MMTGPPAATIVITTRDRREELRRALDSAFAQDVPVEVIVTDDASTDGTADMVKQEFPLAKLLRSEECVGLIVQRNRAAAAATCRIIFSLDDDAEFGSTDTVRRTLQDFSEPRIGAVAIPHIDTSTGKAVNEQAPDDDKVWCVASFTGTAHAVRRDVFLALGGYREDLIHQGEESDYCIRMLAAGLVTRLGRAPSIQHHESPRRSFTRMDFHGRRNDLFFAWRHAPATRLVPHLLGTTLLGLRDAAKTGRWKSQCDGIMEGWRRIIKRGTLREPVKPGVYRLFRELRRHGPKTLDEILPAVPPVRLQSRPSQVSTA
jgi:GT2 family glycosyltransferase